MPLVGPGVHATARGPDRTPRRPPPDAGAGSSPVFGVRRSERGSRPSCWSAATPSWPYSPWYQRPVPGWNAAPVPPLRPRAASSPRS